MCHVVLAGHALEPDTDGEVRPVGAEQVGVVVEDVGGQGLVVSPPSRLQRRGDAYRDPVLGRLTRGGREGQGRHQGHAGEHGPAHRCHHLNGSLFVCVAVQERRRDTCGTVGSRAPRLTWMLTLRLRSRDQPSPTWGTSNGRSRLRKAVCGPSPILVISLRGHRSSVPASRHWVTGNETGREDT